MNTIWENFLSTPDRSLSDEEYARLILKRIHANHPLLSMDKAQPAEGVVLDILPLGGELPDPAQAVDFMGNRKPTPLKADVMLYAHYYGKVTR